MEEPQPTGRAVVEFLTSAAKKGDMNSNTAGAMRNAVKEVLGAVHGDGWESVDVTQIDLKADADRFARLRGSKFKAASLKVYQSRFKNAVEMFLEWRQNPAEWRYTAERPYAERKAKQQKQAANTNGVGTRTTAGAGLQIPEPENVQMIDYPYPLRRGLVVKLRLPADLSRQEASRLTAYVNSLAFEEQVALPAGMHPGQ